MSVNTQLKQLSKDSLFYGLGSALQKFIGFFLFPIYTRILTKDDFGAQDLVFTATTILTYFLILGLDSSTARHYYDAETNEEKEAILSTWLWFELIISIPVSIILIILAEPICSILFDNPSLALYFRIGIATLPFTLISSITSLSLRLTFKSKTFGIIAATGVLIQAVAAIILVAVLELGITGVFLANLIAFICRAILGLTFTYKLFRLSRPQISINWLRPMLLYGLPLVPASLSLWVLNYSNRYFLVRLATLSDIGLLGIGVRISNIVVFIISAFQIAWGPFALSLIKEKELAKNTYSKVFTYFLLISMSMSVGLSIFAREAILILATPSYEASSGLVPWLCFSSIAWGSVYIVGMGYRIAKKSYHTTISTILAALANVGLNFIFIPRWGVSGAVISTFIGNLVALLYNYYSGQFYLRVKYEYRRVISLFLLSSVTIIVGLTFDQIFQSWSPTLLLYKLPIALFFILFLFLLKIIQDDEINIVRNFIKNRFNRTNAI